MGEVMNELTLDGGATILEVLEPSVKMWLGEVIF